MTVPDFVSLLESSVISLTYPIKMPGRYLSLMLEVTILSPSATASALSKSWEKRITPCCISSRSPDTIRLAPVERTLPLTLLLSDMMDTTFAQLGPTAMTLPTRPPSAMTFISTAMPSSLPLSMVKDWYQLPESLAIILAPVLS